MNNIIGDNIRKHRTAKGITQEQLGAKAGGRSVNQINGYERGRSRPSPPVLKDIADALGVKPDALLGTSASSTRQPLDDLIRELKGRLRDDFATGSFKLVIEL